MGWQDAPPAQADATGKQPAWKSAPVKSDFDWRDPLKNEPITKALASLEEPAIKGGANLVSQVAAPFLSQQQRDKLQKAGDYDPKALPGAGYGQAVTGPIGGAILSPVMNAASKGLDATAKAAGMSDRARDIAGKVLGAGMNALAVAGVPEAMKYTPAVRDALAAEGKKGLQLPVSERTPASIEEKMKALEVKHDASKDPKEQAQLKKQMDTLGKQHPAVEEKKFNQKNPNWKAAPAAAKYLQSKAYTKFLADQGKQVADNTKTAIRAESGTANRNIAKSEAQLSQAYKTGESLTPAQTLDFYHHIENASKGVKLTDPTLAPLVEATKKVADRGRETLEALPGGDKMGFYQDYFPHMWENEEAARKFANDFVGKQGSNSATKARKYPTMADGVAAGLIPKYKNPVQALSKYTYQIENYAASKRIVDQMKEKGDAKYFTPGSQPEGWMPLTGRFAERTRAYATKPEAESEIPGAAAIHEKLYAPKEAAYVYNDHYGKGFEATRLAKPFEVLRSANAANTAAELSLSGYHALTTTAQLFSGDLSRIMKNAMVGDWTGVGKAVKSATLGQIPFLKGSTYKLGDKVLKQYKGLEDHGIDMESIAEHFEKGGGRLGQDKLFRGGQEGGFLSAPGGIKAGMNAIKEDFNRQGLAPKGKAALDVMQRAVEDVSYPLFQHYIPRIKTGAFANLMGDWLRQNPEATDAEIAAARKHYIDLVDDRQGELNMDNIFVPKLLKQTASLFLRAQGWDIGLVRQAGGGVLDAAKIMNDVIHKRGFDKKLLDRPAFLASTLATMALTAAAYQYYKTGKTPDEMIDYMAPKTGGITPYTGKPERTILPVGHGRELLHMAAPLRAEGIFGTELPTSGITQEASNKFATLPRNVMQAVENKDYFDNKIAPTTGPYGAFGSIPARAEHVLSGFAPFGLTSQSDKREGSNLSGIERRFLGLSPASREIADPEGFAKNKRKHALEDEKKAAWFNNMIKDSKAKQ